MTMKGQYRIVKEILLFAIGIGIATFILVSFQSVYDNVSEITLKDQLVNVGDLVAGGLVKSVESDSQSVIRMQIPEDVSGEIYRIRLNGNVMTVEVYGNPDISVSRNIFEYNATYDVKGDVVSTAKYIEVYFDDPDLIIKRSATFV